MRYVHNDMHKWKNCWIFRRVRKIYKSDCFLRHVSPFVYPSAWNRSAPTTRISFNLVFEYFRTSVEKMYVSLISDNINVYFTWRRSFIYDNISPKSSCNEIYVRKKLVKKSKHILCCIFFFENRPVYEIMWKICGAAGQVTDDSIIWRMLKTHMLNF